MKTIALMNQKGGVGKTTTAVNLGSILAHEHGKSVLMVDLDPQGNMSDHVDLDPNVTERSIYDVIIDQTPPEEIVQTVHGLDVLPANLDLAGAEVELASMLSRETRLKKGLEGFAEKYDYVLLDCPPSLALLTVLGLTVADEVLIPMQAEYLALRGLSQLLGTIELVASNLNDKLVVGGVIFCMYDPRTLLARSVREEVEKFLPGKVYETPIRRNIRLGEAPSHGIPIDLYDPSCPGTKDYRAIVEEFLQREAGTWTPTAPAVEEDDVAEVEVDTVPAAESPEASEESEVEGTPEAVESAAAQDSETSADDDEDDVSRREPIWRGDMEHHGKIADEPIGS